MISVYPQKIDALEGMYFTDTYHDIMRMTSIARCTKTKHIFHPLEGHCRMEIHVSDAALAAASNPLDPFKRFFEHMEKHNKTIEAMGL